MSELYQRAVSLLARREHTRAELTRKLAPHGTPEEIDIVLNALAQTGLQSDQRFAESYLRSQAGRLGSARLRHALQNKGIATDLAAEQIAELPDEIERARAVWQKKFALPPADHHAWARQARFLQSRGFSVATIHQLLKESAE